MSVVGQNRFWFCRFHVCWTRAAGYTNPLALIRKTYRNWFGGLLSTIQGIYQLPSSPHKDISASEKISIGFFYRIIRLNRLRLIHSFHSRRKRTASKVQHDFRITKNRLSILPRIALVCGSAFRSNELPDIVVLQ